MCARLVLSYGSPDSVASRFVCAQLEIGALPNLYSPRAPIKKTDALPIWVDGILQPSLGRQLQ